MNFLLNAQTFPKFTKQIHLDVLSLLHFRHLVFFDSFAYNWKYIYFFLEGGGMMVREGKKRGKYSDLLYPSILQITAASLSSQFKLLMVAHWWNM